MSEHVSVAALRPWPASAENNWQVTRVLLSCLPLPERPHRAQGFPGDFSGGT